MSDLVLFSGMGGTTDGLVRAGWNVSLCVDYWDKACIAHQRWHPNVPVVRADVNALPVRGPFRFVWASPSCKPWSTANRTPKRGHAHPEYFSLAKLARMAMVDLHAGWLIIENVGGLIWSKEGRVEVDELRASVAELGLCLSMPRNGVIPSNSLGVPQLRRRVFLVVGPRLISIPPGVDWVPQQGVGPLLWEQPERAEAGVVGDEWGRVNGANRLRAARTAVLTDDHPNKWSTKYIRASRGVVDGSAPGRRDNWTRAQSGAVMACEGEKGSWSAPFRAVSQPVIAADPSRAPHAGDWKKRKAERAGRSVTHAPNGSERARQAVRASATAEAIPVKHHGNYEATGRTLSQCCALQMVPEWPLAGFSKKDAHALVGNAVPPLVAEHIGRLILSALTFVAPPGTT